MSATGLVFNIQKFSIHDGPGIRSTVFLKGCPLKCTWCHNIESQSFSPELAFNSDSCTGCGNCVQACPHDAIQIIDNKAVTNFDVCETCGSCVIECPKNIRSICGEEYTVDQLLREIKKDLVFYKQSGGGVTFGGGEAMSQIDFLTDILTACKGENIHTAIDTSGQCEQSDFERILPYTDLFLYDLKLVDSNLHKKYTGASNEKILSNLRYLSDSGASIFIRIPIIPSINDSAQNLDASIEFLKTISFAQLNLLPYNNLGSSKAARFARHYEGEDLIPPSEPQMAEIISRFKRAGFKVVLGG